MITRQRAPGLDRSPPGRGRGHGRRRGSLPYADTDLPPVADRYDGGDGQDLISYLNRRPACASTSLPSSAASRGARYGRAGSRTSSAPSRPTRWSATTAPTASSRPLAGDRFLARGGTTASKAPPTPTRSTAAGDNHISGAAEPPFDGGPGARVDVRFSQARRTCTPYSYRPRAPLLRPAAAVLVDPSRSACAVGLHRRYAAGSTSPCRLQVTFTRAGHVLSRARRASARAHSHTSRPARAPSRSHRVRRLSPSFTSLDP